MTVPRCGVHVMSEMQRPRQQSQPARLGSDELLAAPVNKKLKRQIAGLLRQARQRYDAHRQFELAIATLLVVLMTGGLGAVYWPMFVTVPLGLWAVHAIWHHTNRDAAERKRMKFCAFRNLLDRGLLVELIDSREPQELLPTPAVLRLLTTSLERKSSFSSMEHRLSFLVDRYVQICQHRRWPVSGDGWQDSLNIMGQVHSTSSKDDLRSLRLRICLLETLAVIFGAQVKVDNIGDSDD